MRCALPIVIGVIVMACPRTTSAPDAASPAGAAAVPDAGPWLTAGELDAWIRVQHAAPSTPPGDAGREASTAALRAQVRAEAAWLADAGLTAALAERIEALVAVVVTERTLSRLSGGAAVAQFEQALGGLAPEQRAKAQAALAGLEGKVVAPALTAAEAEFGADAVQIVLQREDDVTRAWDALVDSTTRGATR